MRQSDLANLRMDMSSIYGGSSGTPNAMTSALGNSTAIRQICKARYTYPANQPDELSLERGDRIRVLEKSSDGWWRGMLITEGKPQLVGWFPSNYVTLNLSKNLDRQVYV